MYKGLSRLKNKHWCYTKDERLKMKRGIHMTTAKKMGPLSAFLLGVNGIIGSAIFLLPSSLYAKAGPHLILILLLAGVSAFMLSLCYANLSGQTKGNGAAWRYSYDEFGRFPGFQVGFFTWLQGIMTITTEVAAFYTTLQLYFPLLHEKWAYNVCGMVTIALLACICLLGEKISKIANNISTILKITVLLGFILLCIWFIKTPNFASVKDYSLATQSAAFSTTFYMFNGFAFLPVAANQMVKPEKNLPRVLITTIITVTGLYMLAAVTAIGVLGPSITDTSVPLAQACAMKFGTIGKTIIILGTAGSILGIALSMSFNTPYIASSLATQQLLPHFLRKKNAKGLPVRAIVTTCVICMLLFLSGDYLFLVPCAVVVSLVQYFATSMAAFKHEFDLKLHPKTVKHSTFHLHGGVIIPLLSLCLCAFILINLSKRVILFGVFVFVIGIFLYEIEHVIFHHEEEEHDKTA